MLLRQSVKWVLGLFFRRISAPGAPVRERVIRAPTFHHPALAELESSPSPMNSGYSFRAQLGQMLWLKATSEWSRT